MTSEVVHSLQAYYSYFMNADQIVTSYDVNSEHCLPTLNYGEACLTLSSPYLGNCNYDGAGAALQAIYGELKPRIALYDESRLFAFDQKPYIVGKYSSIADIGYIFVPEACESKVRVHSYFCFCFFIVFVLTKCASSFCIRISASQTATCRLHISFHGCHQDTGEIGDTYARHAGFNEWAQSNDIIVLYPMAGVSNATPLNPNG